MHENNASPEQMLLEKERVACACVFLMDREIIIGKIVFMQFLSLEMFDLHRKI
jgi:hypothetical protein